MQTYSQFSPTPYDNRGLNLPDRQHWFVAPVSHTRDSGCADESNFDACLEMLGGESETVEVHRFGHWGPGWFEIILVDPTDKARVKILDDVESWLETYPLLDEDDCSRREYEAECKSWKEWGQSDFLRALYKKLESWSSGLDHPEIAPLPLDNVLDAFADLTWEEIEPTLGQSFSPHDYAETTDEGPYFYIERLVASVTDLNPLFDLCADAAWTARKTADQRKLASLLGLNPEQTQAALEHGITTVSAMRALATV